MNAQYETLQSDFGGRVFASGHRPSVKGIGMAVQPRDDAQVLVTVDRIRGSNGSSKMPLLWNHGTEMLADDMGIALCQSAWRTDKIRELEGSTVDAVEDVLPVLSEFLMVQVQQFDHRPPLQHRRPTEARLRPKA